MNVQAFISIALLALLPIGCAPCPQLKSESSRERSITAAVAVELAEKAIESKYGTDTMLFQRPYKSVLRNDEWVVFGTLPQPKDGGVMIGGVAKARVSASTGRVLKLTHGE